MAGRRHWLWLVAVLLTPGPVAADESAAPIQGSGLEIGIAPFLPARTLIQNYQPLRDFMEQKLHEPVLIITATDYRTFHTRIRDHHYPLVITVANSACLAHADSGYLPLFKPKVATRPVLVVAKDSKFKELRALRDQTIALPDPLAIISMQAQTWIRAVGLEPGKDLRVRHLPTHSAAVNYVVTGEVAAAIVSDRALQQMPSEARNAVRIVETREQAAWPGVFYLANPHLAPERISRLKELIAEFARTPIGRKLMKDWGYGELVPATAEDLMALAPYGELLKAALAEPDDDTPANGTPEKE